MNIVLNQSEFELLQEILESRLGSLRQEIYRAETPSFKDELKIRKRTLEDVIQKLKDHPQIHTLHKAG